MRDVLSNFLSTQAVANKNFYVLSGDHGYALFDELRKKAPEQFINTGVTEQAMVGCAAGMAKTGKKVVIYGLASFIPMRVLEFIKMNICYERLPIIIIGDGAGTVYTTLGASHQCGEDIACLKTLPIKIFSPADKYEIAACLEAAAIEKETVYLRVGKSDRPAVHSSNLFSISPFIEVLKQSESTAIFATGSMVITGKELALKYGLTIYSCPQLNRYENSLAVEVMKNFTNIISLEEHSIHGGLGSTLADIIAENGLKARLTKFGIKDYFTKGCGSYEYAIKYHGLDFEFIEARLKILQLIG